MECNKIVYDNVKELTIEQNIAFSLSCLNRLSHLPQLFINSEDFGIEYLDKIIPKNTIENILNDSIRKLTKEPLNIKKVDLLKNIKLLEKMLLDDDIESSTEKQIFFYYVLIIIHTFEYIYKKSIEHINLISDAMVEIINQTAYKENPKLTDTEIIELVDIEIDKEVEKEIKILEIIKTGNNELLNEYIKNSRVEYKA